jgi:hypothetical protein
MVSKLHIINCSLKPQLMGLEKYGNSKCCSSADLQTQCQAEGILFGRMQGQIGKQGDGSPAGINSLKYFSG